MTVVIGWLKWIFVDVVIISKNAGGPTCVLERMKCYGYAHRNVHQHVLKNGLAVESSVDLRAANVLEAMCVIPAEFVFRYKTVQMKILQLSVVQMNVSSTVVHCVNLLANRNPTNHAHLYVDRQNANVYRDTFVIKANVSPQNNAHLQIQPVVQMRSS